MGKARLDPVPVIGHRPNYCAKAQRKNQSSASSGICPTSKRARKLSYVGPTLLDSVTEYIYEEGQKCHTSEERDSFSLALAICASVRKGNTDPLASASYAAFGSTLESHLKRRAARQWEQHQALLRCIPDYDPQEDHRGRELQPVASPIISWPVPEAVGEAGRNEPPSRGSMGSRPATDNRKFAEVGARTARTRKRGLGAG